MSSARDVKEPSMEEILSSIRRIIAYDDDNPDAKGALSAQAGTPGPAMPSDPLADEDSAEDDDVLELTTEAEPAPVRTPSAPPPAIIAAAPVIVPAVAPPALPVTPVLHAPAEARTERPALAAALAAPSDAPPPSAPPLSATPSSQEPDPMSFATKTDILVSDTASSATMGAFSRLSQNLAPAAASMPAVADRRTVDDLVADALKPELRAWLDTNLPSIVERLVQQEISKMARRAELV